MDGHDIQRRGLRGKPAPDGFLAASRPPRRARPTAPSWSRTRSRASPPAAPATFGLVIGVARNVAAAELRAAGADVVVADLGELAA